VRALIRQCCRQPLTNLIKNAGESHLKAVMKKTLTQRLTADQGAVDHQPKPALQLPSGSWHRGLRLEDRGTTVRAICHHRSEGMRLGLVSIVEKRSLKNTAGHYRWKNAPVFAGETTFRRNGGSSRSPLLPHRKHQNWETLMSDILIVDD